MSKRKPLAAVVGFGRTSFGEHWEKNFEELLVEAGTKTFDSVDYGIERRQIESCYFAGSLPQAISKAGLLEGYMSRELGLNVPMTYVGGGSASGSSALYEACRHIQAGVELALVGGIEKMSDRVKKIQDNLMFDADRTEFYTGFTIQGLTATMMNRYIYEYEEDQKKGCRESFARIACKNHRHALNNRYAQFRREITLENVLNSVLVADPLRALECSTVSDGAAALILTNQEKAKSFTDDPVYIVASEKATDSIDLGSRRYITGIPSTKLAIEKALKTAKIRIDQVQISEVHDSYTPNEIFFLEDCGFTDRGNGWRIVNDVELQGDSKHFSYVNERGAEMVVNVGGGLKADGNPLGASGVRQVCEIVSQLTGRAGRGQVEGDGVNIGLAHNIGGTGGICNIHILMRDPYE
ncbi:MAG: thiolase domain-containing protein [Nitrososphaeria archaeon]|nr:thiolase domain-containing protein [Nitrososphaeria archaeon]NIQ33023.1 thiolase domain-containing protein [Nitrososphaeria archaeon]